MLENGLYTSPRVHPALSLFFLLLLAGLGFIIGGIAGIFLYLPFYPGSEPELMEALQNVSDHPELRDALFSAQVGATAGGLILAPLVFLKTQRIPVAVFFRHNRLPFFLFLIAGFAVIASFGVNTLLLKWNQDIVFPEFLRGFEEWAREREDEAAVQTEALTKMNSAADLLLALAVIAILPAIGEEFLFRGIMQNEFYRGTRNMHVSIWATAIIFSAIHLQFFGFLPRLLLGAIFGYLYYWSANLWVAIFAHFVNNGAQIVALYYYQRGAFDFDLEKPESVPANVVVVSVLATGGLLYYLYRYFSSHMTQINSGD